jgi:hypothetical protein
VTGAEMRDPLWEPMTLTYVGSVGEVLQGGGGKLSPNCGDPGDPRKPRGQEPPPCHPEENNPTHHPPPGG